MQIEQYVMAYRVEHDRLRAILPEGYTSLRPVLRINAEIRTGEMETVYLELNTPVEAAGRRGWLNIAHWESTRDALTYRKDGKATTFSAPFLEITYTGVGLQGGCPAERDNDGCFFRGAETRFAPAERIDSPKEFCDCAFAWRFAAGDAQGVMTGGKSVAVLPTEVRQVYEKQPFSAEQAAKIPCEEIAGAYLVRFVREGEV